MLLASCPSGLGFVHFTYTSPYLVSTLQAIGYPVVTVQETGETGKFIVEQHRFLASGDVKPEEDQTVWVLNLGVASQSHSEVR